VVDAEMTQTQHFGNPYTPRQKNCHFETAQINTRRQQEGTSPAGIRHQLEVIFPEISEAVAKKKSVGPKTIESILIQIERAKDGVRCIYSGCRPRGGHGRHGIDIVL
jgi:hypothetical protein